MKKSFLAVLLGAVMCFASVFTACGNNNDDNTGVQNEPPELQAGTITFEDSTCESIINEEDSGTVDVAVASNGADVTYTLAEEDVEKLNNAFDGKLSIASDGTIKGSYDAIKSFKVDVTANAEKCDPVTAEIRINIVNPHIPYEGRALVDARQGVEYAASVAYADGEDVSYSLEGTLPAGLKMDKNGTITGIPEEVTRDVEFDVTASAKGFSDSTATFSLAVVINHISETESKIVKFSSAEPIVLEDAFVGTYYVNQSGIARASALNNNNVTYKLADGSVLPEGFTLYSNGAFLGAPSSLGNYTFSVVASAKGCADVTCSFTLTVKAEMVEYKSVSGVLTMGEPADYDLATAVVSDGVTVRYTMTEEDAAALLANYGLTLTEEGRLTGTPTKVVDQMNFKVTAEAEGYTSTTVTMYFRINEPIQAAAGNKFEAEYTDLDEKSGTGWSNSPTGKGLIDTTSSFASNGAFVNYMHNDTVTLEFVIYAEEAAQNVGLYFGLGSEMGRVTFTPKELGVYTYVGNTTDGAKTTVNYGSVTVDGGDKAYTSFNEYSFGTINLVQGWNVIQIAVHANSFRGDGLVGGPGVDFMRLDTSVKLEWVPYTFNLD